LGVEPVENMRETFRSWLDANQVDIFRLQFC
jgi:hypothetical protein